MRDVEPSILKPVGGESGIEICDAHPNPRQDAEEVEEPLALEGKNKEATGCCVIS